MLMSFVYFMNPSALEDIFEWEYHVWHCDGAQLVKFDWRKCVSALLFDAKNENDNILSLLNMHFEERERKYKKDDKK